MLTALSIRDLVLIEQVVLEFGCGLHVLTGETGAGKSILLDGLGLALGERADPALVRKGAAQASASAQFLLQPDHPVHALLAEQDLASDEPGTLMLRRTLKADGGSRAFVNDQPVSAGLLRSIGAMLVEIHGQHDERGLLNPRGHMALLDAFAAHPVLVEAVRLTHAEWQAASDALAQARSRLESDSRDRDWLDHAVAEITALNPQPGEEVALADARANMQKGARLGDALDAIDALVSGGDGALSQLRQAARRLERVADADVQLQAAMDAIDRALVEGDSVEAGLADVRARFLVSPDALEAAESRLFELRAMARKHRCDVETLPAMATDLATRLEALKDAAVNLEALERQLALAHQAFAAAANALSTSRHAAAARLDATVAQELPALKLENARFRTMIADVAEGASGSDQVVFEVSTNANQDFGPLTRIASGGEMSRFTLALKVALASSGSAGTLIFDEIDRGVGGATASAIGDRLARVASEAQVLVVTHSPQVAAAGSSHFRIAKADSGDGMRTRVDALDAGARLEEVARMLSGAQITAEARSQAANLLDAGGGA